MPNKKGARTSVPKDASLRNWSPQRIAIPAHISFFFVHFIFFFYTFFFLFIIYTALFFNFPFEIVVDLIIVPGVTGEYGITAGHTPIISELKPGLVQIFHSQDDEPEKYFVSGGFSFTHANSVTDVTAGKSINRTITHSIKPSIKHLQNIYKTLHLHMFKKWVHFLKQEWFAGVFFIFWAEVLLKKILHLFIDIIILFETCYFFY